MNKLLFEQLINRLKDRLVFPLPGTAAHEPLRATPAGSVLPRFDHPVPPKPGSVLILLYPHSDSIFFPLIKRPDYSGAHSGQVSLPGGKAEAGETPEETALREAHEEIGIPVSEVNIIGRLSQFFVIPSNFMVTPIVGYAESKLPMVPDLKEVTRILQGDLNSILPDEAICTKEILAAGRYRMMAPHFDIEGEVVWGATAMMLNEFRCIVKEIT